MNTGAPLNGPAGMPPGTEALYRAALGPSAAPHYLPIFGRFDQRGRAGLVWNRDAALGNLLWLIYWRLWDAVLVQSALTLVGAGGLGWLWLRADGVPMGIRVGVTLSVVGLWWLLPGLWGTAWLHGGVRQRTLAAVEDAATFKEAIEQLERSSYAWRLWRHWGLWMSAAAVLMCALVAGVAWQQWVKGRAVDDARTESAPLSVPVPVPATPPAATAEGSAGPAAAAGEPPPPSAAEPEPDAGLAAEPDAAPTPAPTPTPTRAAPAPAVAETGSAVRPRIHGYGVNVGMFSVDANARRVKAQLSGAGLPVLEDPIESARGTLTRVRVGPFERREQAEAAAKKVKALGLEARVYEP